MNPTEVRTYKAATMQEALDLVRKELGPDAVILHTRELPKPRLFLWRRSGERVEVTAGTGVNIRPQRGTAPTGAAAAPAQPPARPRTAQQAPAAPPRTRQEAPPAAIPPARSQTAAALLNSLTQESPAVHVEAPAAKSPPASAAPRMPVREGTSFSDESQAAIARQLTSIQHMVSSLAKSSLARADEIPQEMFQMYTELIDADVDEELARGLIRQLKSNEAGDENGTNQQVKSRLQQMVEREIRCAPPIQVVPGRRRVVALVGPTGVGKTTTIAKLAANFRLRDGIRMGLVTVDTYRIAAVEQLRTYAEIIDLPMKVVTSPREMRRALDELAGLDLVLIDTAGRSPRDELKIQELKSLLAEAQVDEVHLVLSLVASSRTLEATAANFAPAGTTSVILTKLDEAVGMGALLSVARKIPLPISYLTTGQDVPDDIEPGHAGRIARLVLGEETLYSRRRVAA
jgi:flagellar biosynthesis protein FlhF